MGIAHRGMNEALDDAGHVLRPGDTAVFINKGWTAAKILTHKKAFTYVRESRPFIVEELMAFPKLVGGRRLELTRDQMATLRNIRQKETGEKTPRQVPKAVA